jgi:hypothetical protein
VFDTHMSVLEASKKWNLSEGYIRSLCIREEIKAIKFRNVWLIEKDQPNPKQS